MATTETLVKLMSGIVDLHQYCLVLEQVIDIQKGVNDSDVIVTDGVIAEQLGLIANRAVDLVHEFVPDKDQATDSDEPHLCIACGAVRQRDLT